MILHSYRIRYQCLNKDGRILKEGTIIAKRKASEFEALAGLEKHLKTKVEGMDRMVCVEIRLDLGQLEDIFKNPFGSGFPI